MMAWCMLQTARFDRHLVRDLTWSRHQLEDLARRRLEVHTPPLGHYSLVISQHQQWPRCRSVETHGSRLRAGNACLRALSNVFSP